MNNKQLTLLITIHNEFNSIEFFVEQIIEQKIENALFAFDCKRDDIPIQYLENLSENGIDFFISNENIGKLKLILNASSKLKTRFFKIVDQDDSFLIENFTDLENKLLKFEDDSLIKHTACILNSNSKLFKRTNEIEFLKKQIIKGKDCNWMQQTNPDTIYPSKIVKEIKEQYLTRQEFHNDVLLSNLCIALGSELKNFNYKFYIHFLNKGQTSEINVNRSECIKELYLNYQNYQLHFNNFNFSKIMKGSIFYQKMFIWAFTIRYYKKDTTYSKNLYKQTVDILIELSHYKNGE